MLVVSVDLGTDAGVLVIRDIAGVLVIRDIEQYGDEICDSENPRTTLVTIRDDAAVYSCRKSLELISKTVSLCWQDWSSLV